MPTNEKRAMIIGFAVVACVIVVASGLVWFWGFREYTVTGSVTSLEISSEGQYLVTVDGQVVSIETNLIMRGPLSEQQIYDSLQIGGSYVFHCWGETPHIYEID
jgi:hypothetical protein